MKKNWLILSTGFALFSMFFGSGNLVFPILVGKVASEHYLLAFFGIFLTGVIVPLLGSFGIILYGGKLEEFLRLFGKKGVFIFSFITLSLLGPFGVVPRCLTVSHGAIKTILPEASLPIVSAVFFMMIFFLARKKRHVVSILGAVLTPVLLGAILLLTGFGVKAYYQGNAFITLSSHGAFKSFINAFVQGYQMMDLLAAFFFSTFLMNHMQKVAKEKKVSKSVASLFLHSSLVGGGLLSLVYFALVFLGSAYGGLLADVVEPQQMLGKIALSTLGIYGAPCLCLIVVLACMTTAVILSVLFAEFLQKEIFREKISRNVALIFSLVMSFFISIRGFTAIAAALGPIVEVLYPILIMLTLFNIYHKFSKRRASTRE